MELESALSALERRAFPVSLVGMPAHRALLRGVPGIHQENLLSECLGLVPEELLQFVKCPVVQLPVERPATPLLDPDLAQIFQSKDRVIRIDNLLRDTMVGVSHKPSFPARHRAEFPRCRPGAFGLQLRAKMSILCSRILDAPGVEKGVIGADRDVHDSSVDTKHSDLLYRFDIRMLHRDMEIEHSLPSIIRDGRRSDGPGKVLAMVLRDREYYFDSSFYRCNRSDTMDQVHRDDPLVVPHSGEWFPFRQTLTLGGFQGFTRTVSRTLHQRGRKIRNSITNSLVGCLVVLHLVPRTVLIPPLGGSRERRGIGPHRIEESRGPAIGQLKFERDCPNHIHILIRLGERYIGGDRAISPRPKGRGLLAQFR